MSSTNIIEELLQNNNPLLCCLCLNNTMEEELVQINDEVLYNPEISLENTVLLSHMIDCVIHQEDFITTFVCNSCVRSTVNAYKFINMCTTATQRLTEFVEGVTSSLEHQDEQEIKKSHRVFIATDVNNLQSTLHYDKKKALPHNKGHSKFQSTLSRFQAICFPETVPKFICEGCGTVCTNRASLIKHMKKNCNRKEEKTACNICSMLISERCIKRHERFCGTRAVEKQTVLETNHFMVHEPQLCNICGKSFKDLKRHLVTHDPNHFDCKKCGKRYRSMKSCSRHMENEICSKPQTRDPSKTKAYKCNVCESQFCVFSALKFHMRIHSDNKNDYFECSWCNKRFSCQAQLTSHAVTHTKEKNWICNICGGQFVTKASLTYHVRTHTGEKPFKCELCDGAFLSASRRRDHMRSKHLPPLLQCTYCPKKFKLHVELSKHKRRHLDPKSSLYIGKKQIKILKDGSKLSSEKLIPTSKIKNYYGDSEVSVEICNE